MQLTDLQKWMDQYPSVRDGVDELVLTLQRRQLSGSYETSKRTAMLLLHVVRLGYDP